jgi:starch-binding outer membrane protein, SusD/RagB family
MKISKLFLFIMFFTIFSCSDLKEEFRDTITEETALSEVEVSDLLTALYQAHRLPYQDQSRFWAAQQHTTDETIGPTRGPDWDDNGIWRVLHEHTWDADHAFLGNTFNELLEIVFNASDIIETFGDRATAQQVAEARFIRAFVMFSVLDGWGQVPFREDLSDFSKDPIVYSGDAAIDLIISEVNLAMADLPERAATEAYVANKDAAKVLLMKAYLNKGTFANRTNPSFPAADMTQVISLGNDVINSSYGYSVSSNYYDNFAPNNDVVSTELIYTNENIGGSSSGNVRSRWFCTLHYNQNPSGWNGFTTIADFYDKFDPNDERRGADYNGVTDVSGVRVGMLIGQQYDQDGNLLLDRPGNPLIFTKEVALKESGSNLEVTGIRVIKYPIDYVNGDNPDNDYVFYRYSDVLLMVAEAELRNGNMGAALPLVNEIRAQRGVPDLTNLTLDNLLDERGAELYWEGQRRTDLIRFGKFLDAYNEKPVTGSERLLFPIPSTALASNPNLVQNPGY